MNLKLRNIGHYFWRHRILWATLLFVAIVGLLDENSFMARYRLHDENEQLRAEIRRYREKYDADTRALRSLERDPRAVEKVARLRLYMKTDNEDVYVVENDTDNE